jgi:hypothetical protein
MRAEASWRGMLPCQPPKTFLKWRGKKEVREGIFEILGERTFENGVHMGTLYDLGIDACWNYVGSFWCQWDMPDDDESEEIASQEFSRYRIQREKPTGNKGINIGETVIVFTDHCWLRRTVALDPPEVEEEFRSKAYEAPCMSVKEERRPRAWADCYGRHPNGGWLIK